MKKRGIDSFRAQLPSNIIAESARQNMSPEVGQAMYLVNGILSESIDVSTRAQLLTELIRLLAYKRTKSSKQVIAWFAEFRSFLFQAKSVAAVKRFMKMLEADSKKGGGR
jgi:hypothetical protein